VRSPQSTRHDLFRRTLDRLHAIGQDRSAPGMAGLRGKASFAGWMLMRTATHPLAKGHRLGALRRICTWQVWRRFPGAGAIAELPHGERLWCPPWSHLAGAWVSVGYHETELPFVRALVRPEDLVLDVGANLGVYTVVSAMQGARVVAFEPNADARALLLANIDLNRLSERVRVSSHALADFSGSAGFTTDLEECNHIARGSDDRSAPVEVRQLDEVTLPDGPITLIKIDVEGYDEAVLRGARKTLLRDQPVLIIETWAGAPAIRELLSGLGYEFFLFRQELTRLPPGFAEDANLIAIHRERVAWVSERLAGASDVAAGAPRARWVWRQEWMRGPERPADE
jgi:FkbM family methyltransferase